MGVRIESQAEPIPGYQLIERLGGGGFGEVWKALAPGGLYKAIKFVYGNLQTANDDEDGSRAEQELKALSRVKSVHHPYILSLERFDIINGQLMIVMELADRTLWDRFRECRSQGLPGIPHDELLGYLQETAEALDLMNNQYQLQHLDIKPQNLFLVYNHVKVADFGLVKDLEGMAATVTGGVTPVYAAPETFDGWVSRFSDQYSLAIVYQELLTGQRPFAGTSMRQLILQHLQSAPDLSALPLADRPMIARALSKNPDDRFPSCLDLVRALRDARPMHGPSPAAIEVPQEAKAEHAVPTPIGDETRADGESSLLSPDVTRNARGRNPAAGRTRRETGAATDQAAAVNGSAAASKGEPLAPAFQLGSRPPKKPVARPAEVRSAAEPAADEHADGIIQPALVLAVGQLGFAALQQLRKHLGELVDDPEDLPHLRLLYIDTDPQAIERARQGGAESTLRSGEVLLARLHRPSHYLKTREGQQPIDSWLDSKVLYRIPRQQNYAGIRALGRLAFVDNYPVITKRIEAELRACCAAENLERAVQRSRLTLRGRTPRVYIVSSISGGTGSGMLLDLAYTVRSLLRKMGVERPEVIGLCLLPPVDRDPRHQPAVANAFAALTELGHFASPDTVFTARYGTRDRREMRVEDEGPPFDRCLAFPFADSAAEARDLLDPASGTPTPAMARATRFLFGELLTPLGAAADQTRAARRREQVDSESSAPVCQAVGTYRILWPRRQLVAQAAGRLCRRLVQRWMSKDARPISAEITAWAQQQWEAVGLRAESLITRHLEKCQELLQQAPEAMFASVLTPLSQHLTPPAGRPAAGVPSLTPVVQAMDFFEKLLGVPEECHQNGSVVVEWLEPGVVQKALKDAAAAIAADCEQKLAELLVRLIEEPRYRLAGAEEAVRQLSVHVEQALQTHEHLARELHERSVVLYQKIQSLTEMSSAAGTHTPSGWKAAFSRRSQSNQNPAAELLEVLRAYPKCRYQSLVLQHVTGLYLSLRGLLSDELREVGFCRQRLSELAELLESRRPAATAERAAHLDAVADLCLLPPGCARFDDAVTLLDASVAADELVGFDQQIQNLIRGQFRALVHVCMASSNVVKSLAPAMRKEAEGFLESRAEGANVVEMYLARHGGDDEEESLELVSNHLLEAYDEAAPDLAGSDPAREICLVAIPAGEAGERFADLVRRLLPHARIVPAPRADEIVIYRENLELPLANLEHLGPAAREIYQQRAAADPSSLHSRGDIADWHAAPAVS